MINNKKVEKKLNNIPFLSPCCTLLTRCPVPIFWEIKTSHRLKKRATAREKRQKVECGKEELQSKAGYRKKVEFVTKQRKGWCFFVLHSAWFLSLFFLFFFGSQQDLWLRLCLFLVLPKFGHIPLSYILLHKMKT